MIAGPVAASTPKLCRDPSQALAWEPSAASPPSPAGLGSKGSWGWARPRTPALSAWPPDLPHGCSVLSRPLAQLGPRCEERVFDHVLCSVPHLPTMPPPRSRMRQLEEELRTMDQTLKSLIASEEEVLGRAGRRCFLCPSLFLWPPLSPHLCTRISASCSSLSCSCLGPGPWGRRVEAMPGAGCWCGRTWKPHGLSSTVWPPIAALWGCGRRNLWVGVGIGDGYRFPCTCPGHS